MKLKTRHLKKELSKILDSDDLSVEEMAIKSNLSRATIYRIFDERSEYTQRAIGRKIATGVGTILGWVWGNELETCFEVDKNLEYIPNTIRYDWERNRKARRLSGLCGLIRV